MLVRVGMYEDRLAGSPATSTWVAIMKYWWYDSKPRHLGRHVGIKEAVE
jgi:hypothetical protein